MAGGYLRREGRSHIGMAYDPNVVDFSGINSSLNLRLTKRATLVSSVNYAPGSKNRTMASLSLIIPLGPRDLLMASGQIDKTTQTATIDYSHQRRSGNGYGYRVRADAADYRGVDAGIYAQSDLGAISWKSAIESGTYKLAPWGDRQHSLDSRQGNSHALALRQLRRSGRPPERNQGPREQPVHRQYRSPGYGRRAAADPLQSECGSTRRRGRSDRSSNQPGGESR